MNTATPPPSAPPPLPPELRTTLRAILGRFPRLDADTAVARLSGGLINDTFAVGDAWVLQRLHPIFRAEVNDDIAALVPHLQAAGVRVPTLVRADDGRPYVRWQAHGAEDHHGVWRVMNRLPGRTLHKLADGDQARSAAELVARFHAALAPVEHGFAFSRPGAHDTEAHMATLRSAVAECADHRLYDEVAGLAERITGLWAREGELRPLPERIGHGDLKASNLLFDDEGRAAAVLDLDTMAWMPLDVELGDALRSWCNRCREDAPEAALDEAVFEGALRGYARGARSWITADERGALVGGLLRISVELSARFAADALRERYFGWDASVAPTRGDHNLLRARNQLDLAEQVARARPRLEALARDAFAYEGS